MDKSALSEKLLGTVLVVANSTFCIILVGVVPGHLEEGLDIWTMFILPKIRH